MEPLTPQPPAGELPPRRAVPRGWLVLAGVLVVLALAGASYVFLALHQSVAEGGQPLLVVVKRGDTPVQVIRRLEGQGVVAHGHVLRAWVRLHDGSRMQAGEYEIPAGATAVDLVARLVSGRMVQRSVTIIEGWNIRQLRAALAKTERLRQEAAGLTDGELMARLGSPGLHPEGRFAPDTYFFTPQSTSDLDILQRAFAAQEKRLATAWDGRAANLPYRDSAELLTMASIVEKETGRASERPDIAGVFVRRMTIGMRLQTDPTVIYGLGADYQGNLTRAHLRQPTPWNTYVIDGLPPTPIAMPGEAALEAAAHPAPGTALYFVGRGDGSHQFSTTLDEHNAAVREFQLRRRADYHSAPRP